MLLCKVEFEKPWESETKDGEGENDCGRIDDGSGVEEETWESETKEVGFDDESVEGEITRDEDSEQDVSRDLKEL